MELGLKKILADYEYNEARKTAKQPERYIEGKVLNSLSSIDISSLDQPVIDYFQTSVEKWKEATARRLKVTSEAEKSRNEAIEAKEQAEAALEENEMLTSNLEALAEEAEKAKEAAEEATKLAEGKLELQMLKEKAGAQNKVIMLFVYAVFLMLIIISVAYFYSKSEKALDTLSDFSQYIAAQIVALISTWMSVKFGQNNK